MTATAPSTAPVNYLDFASSALPALENVEEWITRTPLNQAFVHLLKLRASQMNGCAHCVKMHTADARKAGESNERLDHLVVWRHVGSFTAAEKAALGWIEALTCVDSQADYGPLRRDLRAHYSDDEITALTIVAGMINLWNRIQMSNH
ncbi:AhpD family alkylhydroperoxidase [Rubricella aquisinus]|uniref:AhpD family alkylhydroperoxidase n=1 Tax=Rubricella aquisinus TaxID=2028108 RepID=A0A840WYE1_9RHOB|nr:carboxymuconolactone decarboxylase family protein [Rubricella aquisinus]MBB5515394.1 AhpD family alkylhydroperoxidase [Rubricella aquisinus]